MDLVAAEIREGKAYLHPREEDVTYLVNSNDISIFLNHGKTLKNTDILKIETKTSAVSNHELDKYKKRIMTMTLYESEYDAIMKSAEQYGFKRTDYVLACINSASQKKMEKEYHKIVKNHKELQKMQKQHKVQNIK